MIEESCLANSRGEFKLGLEKAKEASSKEKSLIRQREQAGLTEAHNLDLTFSVCLISCFFFYWKVYQVLFNLANHYAANEMFTEAINIFKNITERKVFTNAGRLQINMGNIYSNVAGAPYVLIARQWKTMKTFIIKNKFSIFT